MTPDLFGLAAALLSLATLGVALLVLLRIRGARTEALIQGIERLERAMRDEAARGREEAGGHAKHLREETAGAVRAFQDSQLKSMAELGKALRDELKQLGESMGQAQKERLDRVAQELVQLTQRHQEGQATLRQAVEQRLDTLRGENAAKLEQMRQTVDEKLQGTLDKRLGESFKLVSERLEQVHKGLGEMQSLATGVGDLKRVLTNVKSRGTWGEVQLAALLEQIFTPDQYLKDAQCRPNSAERVEFAIRMPGRGDGEPDVLLPIDAKFPTEDYERLLVAAERSDPDAVEVAAKALELRIRGQAKEIRDKYVNPPHTTDFAILFLPAEGLYAEVLRRPGLFEQVQRDLRVVLAGPTTLTATLNALRMGFQTLAIEKRSSEVRQVLGAVKTEFSKYGAVLDKVKKKLQEAEKTIDDVGIRRRAIERSLRAVESVPEAQAEVLLGMGQGGFDDEEENAAVLAEE
ncbi:MAG: DNA recombination protein RmuC [Magnetospirillum sp.]|nr:DNA recombination protein RmuC [Magnetospirillum sp.]